MPCKCIMATCKAPLLARDFKNSEDNKTAIELLLLSSQTYYLVLNQQLLIGN